MTIQTKFTQTWPIHFTALSPLVHGSDEKAGNMSFIRQLPIITSDGEVASVPAISGNSFRGKLRRIAGRRIIDLCNVKVPKNLYHLMFSGGAIEKGATKISYEVEAIKTLRTTIPYLGLFGGSFLNDVFPGSLRVEWIISVCKESEYITDIESNLLSHELIGNTFYTRKDDSSHAIEIIQNEDKKNTQMIYETEHIIAGTKLVGSLGVYQATELEIGCLSDTLQLWSKMPTLGGKSAIGHGKIYIENDINIPHGDLYRTHLKNKIDDIKAFLIKHGAKENTNE
jgi:hypothetical protein